ncbi:MAG: DNA mismatch repair endonuclease MutL [Balneolaceae bacterium]|nr:MAG: DNA mismatch repair endonuclease MutL [Balneolaceae bacterium]
MPPELSNKIAAGEVVQRPASVAKELLDNAIDSGADQIRLIVAQAGRTLIQVTDNGCGMSETDAKLCFERHATSKITSIEDLFRVRTMGFRGEAMASIASVSQVEMTTRRVEDEAGTHIEIRGGEEKVFEPAALPSGTSVTVRNLFYNVPARRQFLKTDATELKHIIGVFQNAALANRSIDFEMHADGDQLYHLPVQSLEERVTELFGKQYRASLIPFEEETSYVRIYGLIADPKLARKSRGEQFLFVNGRPFQHRYLSYVILSLFDSWTKQNEYPFYALFFEIDPAQVDVNVHPAKMEVKFDDERSITQLARSVVKKAINQYFMVPDLEHLPDHPRTMQGLSEFGSTQFTAGSSRKETSEVHFPSRINFQNKERIHPQSAEQLYGKPGVQIGDFPVTLTSDTDLKKQERGMGFWQLHNRYIITQTRSGLCMIDQHSAHKRIIYEKALSATEESLPGTQQLLFAQTLELSATDFLLLRELLPIIQRMGFSIELLSGNTAMISGVPADIEIGDERVVLREMLQQYRELGARGNLDARKKVAIAFASRTAVPAGKKLLELEMENLFDQLFACDKPYEDPLGKPTLIYMSLDELKSRFR